MFFTDDEYKFFFVPFIRPNFLEGDDDDLKRCLCYVLNTYFICLKDDLALRSLIAGWFPAKFVEILDERSKEVREDFIQSGN